MQVKVYATGSTLEKWRAICAQSTSNTAAFAAMVEVYYAQLRATARGISAINSQLRSDNAQERAAVDGGAQ